MRAIVLTVWMMSLPAVLTAQDARLDRIREALPAAAVDRIETVLAEADAANLPVGPLLDKALEGAAKGVPAERVAGAVAAYAERLGQAQELVGAGRSPDAVVAAADAVRRGVPPATVRSLAGAHEGELAIPLVVLGDLMAAGVPVDHAYEVVEGALARNSQNDQILAIPSVLRRMMEEGQLPAQAAAAITSAFDRGHLPVGIPAGPPVPPGAGPPEGKGPPDGRGKPPVDPPDGG